MIIILWDTITIQYQQAYRQYMYDAAIVPILFKYYGYKPSISMYQWKKCINL